MFKCLIICDVVSLHYVDIPVYVELCGAMHYTTSRDWTRKIVEIPFTSSCDSTTI